MVSIPDIPPEAQFGCENLEDSSKNDTEDVEIHRYSSYQRSVPNQAFESVFHKMLFFSFHSTSQLKYSCQVPQVPVLPAPGEARRLQFFTNETTCEPTKTSFFEAVFVAWLMLILTPGHRRYTEKVLEAAEQFPSHTGPHVELY